MVRSLAGLLRRGDRASRFRAGHADRRHSLPDKTSAARLHAAIAASRRSQTRPPRTSSRRCPGTNDQKHLRDPVRQLPLAAVRPADRPRTKDGWIADHPAHGGGTSGLARNARHACVRPEEVRGTAGRVPRVDSRAWLTGPIPFRLRPRPTGEASTKLVVTEYDIPRSGHRELNIIRGDRRFVWPHDILLDPKSPYAYYTDHFSFNLGRLDRRTGEVKEFPYTPPPGHGAGRRWAIVGRGSCAPAIPAAARTTSRSIPTATSSSAWAAARSDSIRGPKSSRPGRPAATCSGSIRPARCGTSTRGCTRST